MIVLAGIIEKDQVKPNIGLRRRSSIIASSPIKNNCLEDIVKCEERQVPLCINPHEFQGWTQGKVITQLTVFGVYSRKWDEFMIACEKLKDNHLNNFVASNLRIDLRNWRHHLIGRDSLGDDGQLLEANAS